VSQLLKCYAECRRDERRFAECRGAHRDGGRRLVFTKLISMPHTPEIPFHIIGLSIFRVRLLQPRIGVTPHVEFLFVRSFVNNHPVFIHFIFLIFFG